MSTGLHARLATGLTVAESEESFTRTESVAKWSREGRAAHEAEKEALLFDFFPLLIGAKGVPIRQEVRGRGFFFLSIFFRFIFIVFAVLLLLCRAVLSLSYIQQAYQKKRISLTGAFTYVRHVRERSGRNRPRREEYVASELFIPEAWRRDSWHYQVDSLQLQSQKKLYAIMDLCPLRII